MKLRTRVPKIGGVGAHREHSLSDTLERMLPRLRRMGVTRVADITGLDRLGIPVHNAIVPRSNDVLSVYNGKGTTELQSRVGAIMEAAERYAASRPRPPAAVGSVRELSRTRRVLDLDRINIEPLPGFTEETPISWLEGFDLLHERSVLVPMFLAGYYPLGIPETPPFAVTTTNGLASGNCTEEAICHALCELIERDDWTMADLISYRLSRALGLGTVDGGNAAPVVADWLHERFPNIDLATLPPTAQHLLTAFERAGLSLKVKSVSAAFGIPSFVAVVAEYVSDTFSHSHFGLGTHPDADLAVTRCVTEVAQARVVDIHAMREDIAMPDQTVDKAMLHVKRKSKVNPETWYFKESRRRLSLQDVRSHPSDDVMIDLDLMLDRLRTAGLDSAIVVDLSTPEVPAAVVRVVVPGIESYTIDRSRIGPRATTTWNDAIALVNRARTNPTPQVAS